MTLIAGNGFFRGSNGGGGSSSCGLTANFLFTSGDQDVNPISLSSTQWATGPGGNTTPLTITVNASAFLKGISAVQPIIFDRNGCAGPITFTLTVTPGIIDEAASDTQFNVAYMLPADRSVVSCSIKYNRIVAPGTYTLTVNASCGTCTASDSVTIIIPQQSSYKGEGLSQPLGGGVLLLEAG